MPLGLTSRNPGKKIRHARHSLTPQGLTSRHASDPDAMAHPGEHFLSRWRGDGEFLALDREGWSSSGDGGSHRRRPPRVRGKGSARLSRLRFADTRSGQDLVYDLPMHVGEAPCGRTPRSRGPACPLRRRHLPDPRRLLRSLLHRAIAVLDFDRDEYLSREPIGAHPNRARKP
jgi:hypothetical protein